jgi:hypothetical protein
MSSREGETHGHENDCSHRLARRTGCRWHLLSGGPRQHDDHGDDASRCDGARDATADDNALVFKLTIRRSECTLGNGARWDGASLLVRAPGADLRPWQGQPLLRCKRRSADAADSTCSPVAALAPPRFRAAANLQTWPGILTTGREPIPHGPSLRRGYFPPSPCPDPR